jgi:uncharacterized membrane protein YcaP (DUF421 family)
MFPFMTAPYLIPFVSLRSVCPAAIPEQVGAWKSTCRRSADGGSAGSYGLQKYEWSRFRGMQTDLAGLFAVHVPVLELVIRGTFIYGFLFLMFRFVLRRDIGGLSMADTLLLVLVADAAQNAMAGEYKTITEGLILLTTIIGWNFLLDLLAYHFRPFARLSFPRTLLLVRNGQFITRTLRRQMLSPDEVMSKLREQGVVHLREVRHAYLESDGQISVIRHHVDAREQAPPPPPSAFRDGPPPPGSTSGTSR